LSSPAGAGHSGSAEFPPPILPFLCYQRLGSDRDIEMESEKIAGILGAIVAAAAVVVAIVYYGQFGKQQAPAQKVEQPAQPVAPPPAARGPVVREVPQ